ncbi:hypothetical protein A9Q84_06890 [Halobacteriovorax marinus]|uniref:SAM-dependent methyltransferase n=1 Tax=Halobacteriovorax marinus TaxID=97084 RepID=A0A1Y5FGG3_9BACT|nr:hypothetical protein A9Q84_06890 [Halobacteriovorax marinus]
MKTHLGRRLRDIFDLIESGYSEVWDTCCDHGLLGLAVIEENKSEKVHFVDQVPRIISSLKRKIKSLAVIPEASFELHVLNAEKIKVSNEKSLICICGVGGDVAIGIISELLNRNDLSQCDILISAQYHMFDLRKFLRDHGFLLKAEKLSFERSKGYELLLVSLSNGEDIDPIGSKLFDSKNSESFKYFRALASHYKRKSLGDDMYLETLKLYEDLV